MNCYNCFSCPYTACSACCLHRWQYVYNYCSACGADLNCGGHYSWCWRCAKGDLCFATSATASLEVGVGARTAKHSKKTQ